MPDNFSFVDDSDDAILRKGLDIVDYVPEVQNEIMKELQRRPGLTDKLAQMREALNLAQSLVEPELQDRVRRTLTRHHGLTDKPAEMKEIFNAAKKRNDEDRERSRRRFPGFVAGVVLSVVVVPLFVFLLGNVRVSQFLLTVLGLSLLAVVFLSGLNTALEYEYKVRTTLLIVAICFLSLMLSHSTPGIFTIILSTVYFYFWGWLGSGLLSRYVTLEGWFGRTLVSIWGNDRRNLPATSGNGDQMTSDKKST